MTEWALGVKRLKIGLVLNPVAGVGGPAALKGSDGMSVQREAARRGSTSQVIDRASLCLGKLVSLQADVEILCCPGLMGASACRGVSLPHRVVGSIGEQTTGQDTTRAVRLFCREGVDLVLFAGGDGTARDVYDGLGRDQVALGIPCGVKMHSGVFAINPQAAGTIIADIVRGRPVTAERAEVRDVDEAQLRAGRVTTRFYGELNVPMAVRYLQHTKVSGREVPELVVEEIAADVIENLLPGVTYFIGPGSTTAAIMSAMHLGNTLLGVDAIRDGELIVADATSQQLLELAAQGDCRIVITVIGGQGYLFGRGNQQFSPDVIRAVGTDHIIVVATKEKLNGLDGRPLLVDTGDGNLDQELGGLQRVVTGYEDAVLMRVAS